MKTKTLITLWIIAALLSGGVFFIKQSQSGATKEYTKRAPGQTLLADFSADQVTEVEIAGSEGSTTLLAKEGRWTVKERDGYPANLSQLNGFLRTLSELKVTHGIEAGPSFAPRFGMDEKASSPESRGLTATLKDQSGKELAKVSFGKTMDSVAPASPFGGGASGRYVRNHADDSGFYAVSELFATLAAEPKSWLSEEFIKVGQIQKISVTQAGSEKNEWEFQRADANAEFSFTEAFPGVKVDLTATAPLKSLFSFARFDDVLPASEVEKSLSPDQLRKALIHTFDGMIYEITIQPKKTLTSENTSSPESYLMTVDVTSDLPKERVIPKDEKKEEAENAQKAFEANQKSLVATVDRLKMLKGRTFEVSKFTLDALLKNRTDYMDKGNQNKAASPNSPSQGNAVYTQPIEIPAGNPPKN